jgi:hypothetical protein
MLCLVRRDTQIPSANRHRQLNCAQWNVIFFWSLEWNLLHVVLMDIIILKWFLEFWKICAPLLVTVEPDHVINVKGFPSDVFYFMSSNFHSLTSEPLLCSTSFLLFSFSSKKRCIFDENICFFLIYCRQKFSHWSWHIDINQIELKKGGKML